MSPRRSAWVLVAVGLFAFLVSLVMKAPASAVHAFAVAPIQLGSYSGSLWRGDASLAARGIPIGSLTWRLSALQLLAGRVVLKLDLDGEHAAASGQLSHSFLRNRTEVSQVQGDIALALLASVTRMERTVDANIHLQGLALSLEQGRITAASGQARLGAVTVIRPQRQHLGDYSLALRMISDNPGVEVTDWSGPLAVTGQAWMEPTGAWYLDLRLRADTGDANLRSVLSVVGEPEADGWTPLELRVTR